MKVAVLMSTYNGAKYIKEQIDSVLSQQSSVPIELWVRDDGSQDSTREILQEYADSGKLRWYTGDNLRPAKSFLDLVKHCPNYDFYAFCDQDDYWCADKLSTALQQIRDVSGPAMYFSNAQLVDGTLAYLGRDVYRRKPYTDFYSLVCNGGILGCTMVMNAALIKLIQQAPVPEHVIMHDAYASIVCAMFDGLIVYDEQPHMQYRQHGNNVVGSNWNKVDALKDRVRKICVPEKISIAQQAESLLVCFPQLADPKKKAFLQKVSEYKKSVWRAAGLALSSLPRYNSKNMSITARLATLLRNR